MYTRITYWLAFYFFIIYMYVFVNLQSSTVILQPSNERQRVASEPAAPPLTCGRLTFPTAAAQAEVPTYACLRTVVTATAAVVLRVCVW